MNKKREPKTVYCHDARGYFVGEDSDYGQNPPNNSKYKKPTMKDGFISRWPVENPDADDWEQVENHKGENGYVDGQYTEIKEYGPYPEGWSADPPPPPPDTRTPEEKRQAAYKEEADTIRQQIEGYRIEAEALRAEEDESAAAACDEKASALLKDFLAKKQEIRERYPEENTGE